MEREILLTGIGGQGVQLAAQVLARAAAHEGRGSMVFGIYSGVMRGGNSDSSVVVSDGEIATPPVVSHAWSALVMHHKYWEPMIQKIRSGGIVVLNSTLFEGSLDRTSVRAFDVPATEVAIGLGNEMAASMVMVGAYVAITGLVDLDSAVEGMRDSLPPYRRQHAAGNEKAIAAGFDAMEASGSLMAAPAWDRSDARAAGAPR